MISFLITEESFVSSAISPSPDHLLLASFAYDPSLPSHIQTFPVSPEIVDLGVNVGIVIFRVDGNWGGAFTCVYRVKLGSFSRMNEH